MNTLMRYMLDPQFMLMVLVAVAAFATVTSFVLPLLSGDRLDSRMKYVSTERDRLRAERIARLADEQRQGRLRKEPKSFMKRVVEQLNLRKALETDTMRDRLKMAGFRGQAPVVAFLFFRATLPIVTFGVAFFYLFFVNTYHLAPLVAARLVHWRRLSRLLSAQHLRLQPHPAPPEIHQARVPQLARPAADLRAGRHVGRNRR